MSIITNHIPFNIIWDKSIARVLNAPLEDIRKGVEADDYPRIDREINRLLVWLTGPKIDPFAVDHNNPDGYSIQVHENRMLLTVGRQHAGYVAALNARFIDPEVIASANTFGAILLAYFVGYGNGFVYHADSRALV